MEKNNSEDIFEKGEQLYPISNQSDEKCKELHFVSNWAELFYSIKTGKSKERYIEIIKTSEHSEFFLGLSYEYGINGLPQKLQKAFKIYKESANDSNDTMSMYRMYHIYKNDYNKFGIEKRNRILEKFYLFKCYSFLRFRMMLGYKYLLNRFNISKELNIHFEEEDPNFEIFPKFINFMKENYNLYEIEYDDILLIDAVINFILDKNKDRSLYIFNYLSEKNNLEAIYKFACLFQNINGLEEVAYNILYEQSYYRSYPEIGLYLYSEKKYEKALEVIKKAIDNGIISIGFLYYDIFYKIHDFKKTMDNPIEENLFYLFEILIDEILTDNVFCFFEYLYFRKICIKHFNLRKQLDERFGDYTKEIVEFLMKIIEGENTNIVQEKIKRYYIANHFYGEFNLACGILFFYGIDNLVKKDIKKSLFHFTEFDKASETQSYKRFGIAYLYKAKKYFYDQNQLKESKNEKTDVIVTKEELEKTGKEIYELYIGSIDKDEELKFSSSYYYYFSRLYNKKIGNNGDKINEYIYLKQAAIDHELPPGTGSILSIFRRYKAQILLDKYKDEFKKEIKNIQKIKDNEGYGEDGAICPICFTNERNWICLPCKHLYCGYCIEKVEKCPICRRAIFSKEFLG